MNRDNPPTSIDVASWKHLMNEAADGADTSGQPAAALPPAALPDVSFIVGAFNVGPFIAEAVRSALDQVDVRVEVVVVDDASIDDTAAVVARMAAADPRVVLYRRPRNGGLSAARNDAIARARGRWIAVLDGDDVITPVRSRRLIDLAEASGADIIADNFERIAEDGTPLGTTMMPTSTYPHAFAVDLAAFVGGNVTFRKARRSFGAVKQMYNAKFIAAHGLRYREDPDLRNEDFLFCAEALRAGARFVITSETFYKYRQRRTSISYRLTSAHFAAMLRANADLALLEHARRGSGRSSDRLIAAVSSYDDALTNGSRFVRLVESVKRGARLSALSELITAPALWPLTARFGTEAIVRRLSLSAPRTNHGGRPCRAS